MQTWQSELKRFALLLALALLVGRIVGYTLLASMVFLVGYVIHSFYQLWRLQKWLSLDTSHSQTTLPESYGLWGAVFDGIYRLQKRERKASAYLESIIDKAQESSAALEMGVIMINKYNNLDWWNRASESLLGLKYPQDRNQSVTNLIRNPEFTEYFYNENYGETLKVPVSGSSDQVLEFQIALFGEHERLIIVRDITQLHRLESMRKDFVGNVSHELGTPITVIKGYLEAILDHIDDVGKKWRDPILQMQQQSIRMESIVRDLLVLTALETKTPPRTQDRINLAELLSEIQCDSEQVFNEKHHKFILECNPNLYIEGQRNELYSAISNLVVNAAKYTAEGGEILLRARFTEESTFSIEVHDNGIGIEPRHIPRLTERFYRVDVSRSSESGGTGLGLAIVKHILARHQAILQIESELNKGSVFSCVFPRDSVTCVEEPGDLPNINKVVTTRSEDQIS